MFTCGPAFFGTKTVTDPYWTDVLLLLNGQSTLTKDASSFNNTMTANGSFQFSAAPVQLFAGSNTYYCPNNVSAGLSMNNTFFSGKFSNNEWCFETWYYPTGSNNLDGKFSFVSSLVWHRFTSGLLRAIPSIGSGTYTIDTATGILPANQWSFISISRDKTNVSLDYVKIYVNGTLAATSTSFSKNVTMDNNGNGYALGAPNQFGSFGYFSNFRVTRNHARYYSNYNVPTMPFPTS